MSLRHLVLLRFTEGTTEAEVTAITEALQKLPAEIPELEDYAVGPDLALSEGTWDYGIAAAFSSEADWATYRDHPEHQRIIRELIAPVVAERAAVQHRT